MYNYTQSQVGMTEVWKYVSQNEMRRVDELLQVVTLKVPRLSVKIHRLDS